MRVLIIVLLLLSLGSVYISWLDFPLSATLNAQQIAASWQDYLPISLAHIFQLCTVFACLFLMCRQYFVALVLLSLSLAQLLFLPWYTVLLHSDWIVRYLIESQERKQFYYFTREYFVDNINAEPTYVPIMQFANVLDQLSIAFSMLSIGWYIALLANTVILIILFRYWQQHLQALIMLTLIAGFALFPVYSATCDLFRAGQAQYQGDQALLEMRAGEAIKSYQLAFKLNPTLSYSLPFLLQVADAYALQAQQGYQASNISRAWIIIQQYKLLNRYNPVFARYRQARTLLQQVGDNYPPGTRLEQGMHKLVQRLINQLWISEGLAQYRQGHLHKAMQAFQQVSAVEGQIFAHFFLATLYIRLNVPQLALEFLKPYVKQILHPSIKADIYCTVGDAYTKGKDWLQAREAYLSCTKLDNTKNYRVTRALSGF